MDGRLPDPGDALTGVDLFASLDPEVRQRVIAAAVPRTYRKGQLLFVENDPGESLIVLRRGAVAVFRTSPTGEDEKYLAVTFVPEFDEAELVEPAPVETIFVLDCSASMQGDSIAQATLALELCLRSLSAGDPAPDEGS